MQIRHTIELGIFKTQRTVVDIIDLLPESVKPSSLADFAKGFKRFSKEVRGEKGLEKAQQKEVTALDEKLRKRDFRRLWITRINAAARQNGTTYGRLIHNLKSATIDLDRKVLADIAVHDPEGFAAVVDRARQS